MSYIIKDSTEYNWKKWIKKLINNLGYFCYCIDTSLIEILSIIIHDCGKYLLNFSDRT